MSIGGKPISVLVPFDQTGSVAESKLEKTRPSANYVPSIWGDDFLATLFSKEEVGNNDVVTQLEELKSETRKKLAEVRNETSLQQLQLVDAIQNLGLDYHFVEEIEDVLEHIFNTRDDEINDNSCDLYHVSLHFRLLRRQGHYVSCDVFNKFKDSKGSFKDELIFDLKGMLSLHEAVQLCIRGETILDEAYIFTCNHLSAMADQLTPPLQSQVIQALKYPIHKDIPRLKARKYLVAYQEDATHDSSLLKLAKLDFNQVQKLHQQELSQIIKWWRDLDFTTKMPFARDRVVEDYFWALSVYFEPQNHYARTILAKMIFLASIFDDIYDAQGTPDELLLLTEAINRWDMSMMEQLPEYMRIFFETLLDFFSEIEEEMAKQGRSYLIDYAIDVVKKQAKTYLEENNWLSKNYVPNMEEYMRVALVSSGSEMLSTITLVGLGDIVTKDSFEWVLTKPKTMRACLVIGRLVDDIVTHKFEQQREHIASAVECFMNEYNVSEQEACEELNKQVADAWKDINEGCLKSNSSPFPHQIILNLAHSFYVIYKDGDGYTDPELLKDSISSLLRDPVPI